MRMTFLCYHSLLKSLPLEVRNLSVGKKFDLPVIPYKVDLLARNNNLSKMAYKEFIKSLKSKYGDSGFLGQNMDA